MKKQVLAQHFFFFFEHLSCKCDIFCVDTLFCRNTKPFVVTIATFICNKNSLFSKKMVHLHRQTKIPSNRNDEIPK